jgi:hypothetical protein
MDVVPVMARSADNGGCDNVRKIISTGLGAGEQGIRCCFSPRGGWWIDLRKTARGASSPAKPALHIPELAIVSSCPESPHSHRAVVEGLWRRWEGVGAIDADRPSTAGMTRVVIRGTSSPIVDDEGCDFLCSWT